MSNIRKMVDDALSLKVRKCITVVTFLVLICFRRTHPVTATVTLFARKHYTHLTDYSFLSSANSVAAELYTARYKPEPRSFNWSKMVS